MTYDDPTIGECDSILHCVTKLKGLKIASLNVNSLLKHIDEIRHFLFKFPFDIFAINESKIDDSITDGEISISGFNLIRKDHSRAGGGVVLYIRESLSYIDRNDLVPDRLEMLKSIAPLVNHFLSAHGIGLRIQIRTYLMNVMYFFKSACLKIKK